ncbi:MAG: hypothetical protein IJ842_05500 [Bacilli bacterium]|nr:hypothetical protein [Bacilli bacterium]
MITNKKPILISILLLLGSFNLLSLASIYYKMEQKIVDYRYSDKNEYLNVEEGIDFINKLPIQFNITNKFFSNFDNLDQKTREEIILGYVIKNNYKMYQCGNSNYCIDKESLKDPLLLEKFNSKTEFQSNNIQIYIDDYGVYQINTTDQLSYYRLSLKNDNNNYRKYSKFSHYKEENGLYVFYFYEGYYKGNCIKDEELELYDFMTGKVIYKDTCNGNNEFTVEPTEEIENLQLYKYELKKDENDKYYLYGYNPVNG